MNELPNPFHDGKIIKENCPNAQYVQSVGAPKGDVGHVISRSSLMQFRSCPRKWLRGFQEKDTDATEFGSLVDCMLLQPDQFQNLYVICPATYPAPKDHAKVKKGEIKEGDPLPWNAGAKVCSDWEAQQGGKTIIKAGVYEDAVAAVSRLNEEPESKELLDCSRKQVLVVANYTHKETGITIRVKGLIDMVPSAENRLYHDCLADLKTARSAAPYAWQKVVEDKNYHVQAANFLWLYNAATGEERNSFLHLIVENEPPFETGHRLLSTEYLEMGRMRLMNALDDYCRCVAAKSFPGYDRPEICMSSLPGWSITEPTIYMMQRAE